jgi:Fic family protein
MFEYIHPFADGNGRVGRTLLNYFLITRGHPPLIVCDEDKSGYYATLQAYDETEDLDSLYIFLKEQTVKTWAKALKLSEGIRAERTGMQGLGII